MNGIELLKADHRRVDDLFNQIELESDVPKRKALYREINSELLMHAHIEEQVLYPFFLVREDFRDMVEEALDEHQEAKSILQEIDVIQDDNEFDNLVGELVKAVRHHVKEEENEFFPKIESVLGDQELEVLGDRLQAAKQTPVEDTLAA